MDRSALNLVDMAAMVRGTPAPGGAGRCADGTDRPGGVHRDGADSGQHVGQFPYGQFPYGMGTSGVHEIAPATYGDSAAALGFALAAGAARRKGALVWVREAGKVRDRGEPCGDGLRALGIDPGRLLIVTARKPLEALWTVEEAMKSGAAGLVLAEVSAMDFTASRRLMLAGEAHGSAAMVCLPHTLEGATAATARWRVSALPSAPNRFAPGQLGRLRFSATLERARHTPHATGRSHGLEFNNETLSLDLVPGLGPGQAAPAPSPQPRTDGAPDTGPDLGQPLHFARTG